MARYDSSPRRSRNHTPTSRRHREYHSSPTSRDAPASSYENRTWRKRSPSKWREYEHRQSSSCFQHTHSFERRSHSPVDRSHYRRSVPPLPKRVSASRTSHDVSLSHTQGPGIGEESAGPGSADHKDHRSSFPLLYVTLNKDGVQQTLLDNASRVLEERYKPVGGMPPEDCAAVVYNLPKRAQHQPPMAFVFPTNLSSKALDRIFEAGRATNTQVHWSMRDNLKYPFLVNQQVNLPVHPKKIALAAADDGDTAMTDNSSDSGQSQSSLVKVESVHGVLETQGQGFILHTPNTPNTAPVMNGDVDLSESCVLPSITPIMPLEGSVSLYPQHKEPRPFGVVDTSNAPATTLPLQNPVGATIPIRPRGSNVSVSQKPTAASFMTPSPEMPKRVETGEGFAVLTLNQDDYDEVSRFLDGLDVGFSGHDG